MKRKLLGLALALAAAALPAQAFADVFVTAQIFKFKDVFEFESKLKVVFVRIDVCQAVFCLDLAGPEEQDVVIGPHGLRYVLRFRDRAFRLQGAAEANALVNQRNEFNVVNHAEEFTLPLQGGTYTGGLIDLDALITDSIIDNSGIVGVNQDVGNMVNQANVVAFAITNSASAVADAQAEADQINVFNISVLHGRADDSNPDRNVEINGSIKENRGIVGVNQNAGNMNNQANLVALAVADSTRAVALSEAALGQVNSFNIDVEQETVRKASITGSIQGNVGIVQVNQAAGVMANQGNVVAIGAAARLF